MTAMHTVKRFVQSVWAGVLDLVYPPHCLHCSARTPTSRVPLCSRCLQRLERAEPAIVTEHLQRLPVPHDALDRAMALWRFDKDGALQRVQHALKYGNRPRYGIAFGTLMAACLDEVNRSLPNAIVPIPLHRTRRYERGYNQSLMLARGLAQALDVPVRDGWLERPRATRSQTHLSRAERWANVSEAFHVPRPAEVQNTDILLVDDIITTGSTAVAAAATLKEAGAQHVALCALAFARG